MPNYNESGERVDQYLIVHEKIIAYYPLIWHDPQYSQGIKNCNRDQTMIKRFDD